MTDWRSIDTVPQGAFVLVWSAEDRINVAARYDRYNWTLPKVAGTDIQGDLYYPPTHWMPLPEPPA